jgi:hypothetical protein
MRGKFKSHFYSVFRKKISKLTQILDQCQWLTPVILVTQVTGIRSIMVQSQPGKIICETLSQKHHQKKRRLVEWLSV